MTRNECFLTKNEQKMRDFEQVFQGKPEKGLLKRALVKMGKIDTDWVLDARYLMLDTRKKFYRGERGGRLATN